MFEKIRNLRNKKGFTLVELIVVLVILAILAALLIPALTGYIDKARTQSIIAETRQTVMAAQTCISEAYGKNTSSTALKSSTESTTADGKSKIVVGDKDVSFESIAKLAEVTETNIKKITINDKAKITYLEYTKGGKTCKYDPNNSAKNTDGEYNVS